MSDELTGAERRKNNDLRNLIERVADASAEKAAEKGALKALQKFGDLLPYDMSEKEGREQARKTFHHAHKLRTMCEMVTTRLTERFISMIVWLFTASLIGGVAWWGLFGKLPIPVPLP
tara:strand:+ start:135 stop:488 length:354 start_codon:yes stop_codon:yes gene_type:complete